MPQCLELSVEFIVSRKEKLIALSVRSNDVSGFIAINPGFPRYTLLANDMEIR